MSAHQDAAEFFREFEGDPEYDRERAIARTKNSIGRNVNRIRRERGLTQVELAQRAGMRQPRIAEIERGEYNIRLDTLAKIAWGMHTTVEELTRDEITEPCTPLPVTPKVVTASIAADPFSFNPREWAAFGRKDIAGRAANDNFALVV
jgi:transcriptional regulator with XRE-family HTH domain